MDKVAIVFWTGSGNTEAMAQAVEEGAKNAGAETVLNFVGDTSAAEVATFDKIILGYPARSRRPRRPTPAHTRSRSRCRRSGRRWGRQPNWQCSTMK